LANLFCLVTISAMSPLQSQRLRLLEGFVRFTDRVAKRVRRLPERPKHLETGRQGEEAAYFYLRRSDYTVVARGWRSAKLRGDLDLIAWEGHTLCFVEVKTRSSREVATAESAVDEEKMKMLRRLARHYIRSLPAPPEQTRFDIVSVYFLAGEAPDLELFRDAFGWY
jgi:putative endonuclease